MSGVMLTLTDVHRILRDRIASGIYTVGVRLPSCRALATELGTNPSTVDRAVQKLADSGLVRTAPRQGSVVIRLPRISLVNAEIFSRDLHTLLSRAQSAGLSAAEIQRVIADALTDLRPAPRVAFVECNPADLRRMSALVETASGIPMEPVLLSEATGRRLDAEYDIIAAPIFHLRDLESLVDSFNNVIEIIATPSAAMLRRLATLGEGRRVIVAAPTNRGLDRMAALVRQYYDASPERFLIGHDDISRLTGADTLIRNNAGDLPDRAMDLVGEVLVIEWELTPDFGVTFPARVSAVVNRHRES